MTVLPPDPPWPGTVAPPLPVTTLPPWPVITLPPWPVMTPPEAGVVVVAPALPPSIPGVPVPSLEVLQPYTTNTDARMTGPNANDDRAHLFFVMDTLLRGGQRKEGHQYTPGWRSHENRHHWPPA
jgi:hypothetical protein